MSLFRREEAACRAELSEITGRSRWAPQPRSPHTGRSGPTRPAWSLSQCQGPSRKSAPKVHWSVTGLCQEEEEPVASPSDKPHSDWSSPPGLAALSWAQRPPVHGHWCRWQELDREWVSTEASRLLNSHRRERGDPEEWEQEPGRPQSHRLLPGSGHGAVTGWPGLGPAVAARSGGGGSHPSRVPSQGSRVLSAVTQTSPRPLAWTQRLLHLPAATRGRRAGTWVPEGCRGSPLQVTCWRVPGPTAALGQAR